MLGMTTDDQAVPVLLDFINGFVKHRDDVLVQRVHLGVEFQTSNAITQVVQCGAKVFLDHATNFLDVRQENEGFRLVHLDIALAGKIPVVLHATFTLVESALRLFQHFIDQRWDSQPHFLHLCNAVSNANGIPHFKRAKLPVKSPLHRVVDVDNVISNLTNSLGGVRQSGSQRFPRQLLATVLAVKQRRHSLAWVINALGRLYRIKVWSGSWNIFHRLPVQIQRNALAVCIHVLFVESTLGLATKPLVFNHLMDEFRQCKHVPLVILRQVVIAVGRNMFVGINTNQVSRLKRR